MPSLITRELIDYTAKLTGIRLENRNNPLLEERLRLFCIRLGLEDVGRLAAHLRMLGDPESVEAFIDIVTIRETLWFRDKHPFVTLTELMGEDLGAKDGLRVWSAACSTGQEPFSLVMATQEAGFSDRVEFLATDISHEALEQAQRGEYGDFEMARGLSRERVEKFFTPVDGVWKIDSSVREKVFFECLNLIDSLKVAGEFDYVLLRNVLIYFDQSFRDHIIGLILNKLRVGGKLFLGGVETLGAGVENLKHMTRGRTGYYQKVSEI